METNQEKVTRLEALLAELQSQPGNEARVNLTAIELDEARAALAQEQAVMVRVQTQEEKREQYTLPTDFNSLFSSSIHLDADGNPHEVTNANQIIRQVVKDALRINDEDWNAKYSDLEAQHDSAVRFLTTQRDDLQTLVNEKDGLIDELKKQLNQAVIEKEEAEAKRDAAVRERKEIEVKESQDLAALIAEQEAEKARKAAEDRAKRTVYDVVPDSTINPRNFTAKLAATGETITYNWTQQKSYIVLTDPNEVEQFRQQHAELNQQDHATTAEPVQDSTVTPEATFPEIPTATAPEVPSVSDTVDQGQPGVEVAGETLEARVAASEAHVFGYVKGDVA